MEPRDVASARERYHLLDVREGAEWTAGHIEGAQHIPLGQLGARLAEVPEHVTVVTVCRSGHRSDVAAGGLRRMGRRAENLDGGVAAWQRAGLPLIRNDGAPGRVI
ncbi:MAG: rhodanese-like domain-containing protein [Chloroflexota bacterium]|nr:rhodanese-like domain-containing protein [Chloroflexota bacterium]